MTRAPAASGRADRLGAPPVGPVRGRARAARRLRLVAPRHDLVDRGRLVDLDHRRAARRRPPCPSTARWRWPSRWSPAPTRPTAGRAIKASSGWKPDHPPGPGAHLPGRQGHLLHRRRPHPARPRPGGRARWWHRAPAAREPGHDRQPTTGVNGGTTTTTAPVHRARPSGQYAAIGAPGSTTLAVYPPNDPNPPTTGPAGARAPRASSPPGPPPGPNAGVDLVCPFFTIPSWQSQSAGCSTTKPAGETDQRPHPRRHRGDRPGRRGRAAWPRRAARRWSPGVVLFPQIPSAISYGSPIAVAAESCVADRRRRCARPSCRTSRCASSPSRSRRPRPRTRSARRAPPDRTRRPAGRRAGTANGCARNRPRWVAFGCNRPVAARDSATLRGIG